MPRTLHQAAPHRPSRAPLGARVGSSVGRAFIVISLLLGALLARPSSALAAEPTADEAVEVAVSALEKMLAGNADEGIELVRPLLAACKACPADTRGILLGTLGILYGTGKKDLERSRLLFEMALREDPSLQLDPTFANKEVQKVFAEASKEAKRTPDGPGKGATRIPPSGEQLEAARAAEAQLAGGNWSDCMGSMLGSLGSEEYALGKLVLARCEEAGGLLLEARKDAELAKRLADEEGDAELAAKAAELVEKLENDTPRIVVVVPASVDGAVIKIDGVEYDKEAAKKGVPLNPGKATVEVTGKKAGYPFNFKTVERVDRGERVTVDVAVQGGTQSSAVQACLANAKTAAEVAVCLETGGKGRGLTFRGGVEVTSYNDTTHVDVLSPGIKVSLENPTEGWLVGGTALVDVVTAASPDIVATASRRFDQGRFAGTFGGEYKIGFARVGANAGISWENDYVGRAVGGRVSADVLDKRLTPSIGYQYGWDTIGMSDTSYDQYSQSLDVHTIDGGVSAVLSAETLLLGGVTVVHESGDQSKPYRHVPMFSADVAGSVPKGATPELVAGSRLPIAPREQLPLERTRFAGSAGVRHRFESATLRVDERLYTDSWGMLGTTTDARFLFDLDDTQVGPHLRAHVQSGVSFWQRAYTATLAPEGNTLPEYRAGDRELGPLFGITVGGSIRHALTEALTAGLQIDGIYTQFLDHIYLFDRWGVFTATTLEVLVE